MMVLRSFQLHFRERHGEKYSKRIFPQLAPLISPFFRHILFFMTDLLVLLGRAVFGYWINQRRIPRLEKFAEEQSLHFNESVDDAALAISETKQLSKGTLRNSISGVMEQVNFVYFEHVISAGEVESVVAIELHGEKFSLPRPARFGFRTDCNSRYGFFWWDRYLVPLNEIKPFLRQGARAFQAATPKAG